MEAVWIVWVIFTCLSTVTGQGIVVQEVRLANGNTTAGRVEVRVGNVWGTVCDDQWDNLDASVICKQLNFRFGGIARGEAYFGEGTGTIFLDDVNCDGSEAAIDECKMTTPVNGCTHSEDAGVECYPNNSGGPAATTPPTTPAPVLAPVPDNCAPQDPQRNVRLQSFTNVRGVGIVEVRYNSTERWGTVCDDFFDENAARVVCRMLCFDPVYARAGAASAAVGNAQSPMILDDVRCRGNEGTVQDCTHRAWGEHNCKMNEPATVTCVDLPSQPPVAPVPVLDCREGFLIAAFNRTLDPYLEEKHLSIANPMTTPCVPPRSHDNRTVVIRIPFDTCGTEVTYNDTHLIYSNVIKYDMTRLEGSISRVNTFMVQVTCEMPRRPVVTRPIDPQTRVVTQKSTGQFVVTMTFYRNNSFSDPVVEVPLRIPLGEWLNVALQLESVDSRLKLVVPDCVATPNGDVNNAVRFPLFSESCRDEPTLTFFNLNQTRFGYRYQPFMFVGYDEVYLHCGTFVCLMTDTAAECDRSCNSSSKPEPTTNGRRKREAPSREKIFVHSGPLIVYKLENSMTVLERISNPQTYSTTFSVPLSTSTPTPEVTSRIGTSFKVFHHSSTTSRQDEDIGSGDTEQYTTMKSFSTTRNNAAAETNAIERKIDTTTKQDIFTTIKKNTLSSVKPKTETTATTYKRLTSTPNIPVETETPKPDGGFFVERGGNSKEPASNSQNVLRGYVPALSDSVILLPSSVLLVFSFFTFMFSYSKL